MAARKSILSAAIPSAPKAEIKPSAPAAEAPAAVAPTPFVATPKRIQSNKGKYHFGGYVDADLPIVEEFRVLAARTRISQQDLVLEAVSDLVAKYSAQSAFNRKSA